MIYHTITLTFLILKSIAVPKSKNRHENLSAYILGLLIHRLQKQRVIL